MIVVDSSGWVEVIADGPLADRFEAHLMSGTPVLVPTIVIYEVYKIMRRERSETDALAAVTPLRRQRVIPLGDRLALEAADVSTRCGLPMADAIVYATAQAHEATLVTCDRHFAGLPGVEYIAPEGE
jgi:predicted nucleic acid-binding protein